MSVRPAIYPINAVEPIRQALGCRDPSLVSRIREAYVRFEEGRYQEDEPDSEAITGDEFADGQEPWEIDKEELRRLTKLAKSFVNGRFSLNREPGEWSQVIVYLADALGLALSKYPLFGDWTSHAWRSYLARVWVVLSEGPRELLRNLVEGRSLTGREIEKDGCWYAWLTSSEISELHAALREVPENVFSEAAQASASPHDLLLPAPGGLCERGSEASESSWLPEFHAGLVNCLSACAGKDLFLAA